MPQLTSRGLAVALFGVAALTVGLVTSTAPLVVLGAGAAALVVAAVTSRCLGDESSAVGTRVELPPGPLLQRAAATLGLSFEIPRTSATGPLLIDDPARAWVRKRVGHKTVGGDGGSAWRSGPRSIVRIGRLRRVPQATGEASTMAVGVPTGRRGLATFGPCRLWRADWLQLCVRRVGATPSVPVLVCPNPTDVLGSNLSRELGASDVEWSAPSSPVAADEAARPTQRTGDGDQWHGLRDHVPGDRLATVHWPLSLRRGRLLAREMSSGSADQVMVVVDLSTHAAPTDVDRVASAAAAIGVAHLRQGRSVAVGLWRGGSCCRVAAPETVTELLSLLALVETMEGRWQASSTLGAQEVDGGIVLFTEHGELCWRHVLAPAEDGATEAAP